MARILRQPQQQSTLQSATRTNRDLPADLAAGPCIEVWVPPGETPPEHCRSNAAGWYAAAAITRFLRARKAWAASVGKSSQAAREAAPTRAPYSAAYLVRTGREDEARARLGPLSILLGDRP